MYFAIVSLSSANTTTTSSTAILPFLSDVPSNVSFVTPSAFSLATTFIVAPAAGVNLALKSTTVVGAAIVPFGTVIVFPDSSTV